MKLGGYCLLALGMAGLLAVGAAATTTSAEARYVRPYRCCSNVCGQWEYLRNSIGARCLKYVRRCEMTSSYRTCHGFRGPK